MASESKSKTSVDWEKVEREYRAGLLSLREIGEGNGCSHVAVSKRAKADGWVRDLKAKIEAKAAALVNRAEVTKSVNAEAAVNERQMIEAGAEAILRVKLGHRTRINRHAELIDRMQEELEECRDDLAARVDISKKLSDTLKTLITLERDAFDIVTATKLDHTSSDGSMTPRTFSDMYGGKAEA